MSCLKRIMPDQVITIFYGFIVLYLTLSSFDNALLFWPFHISDTVQSITQFQIINLKKTYIR